MHIILGLEKNLDSRSLSLIETYNSISNSKAIFIKSTNNFLIARLFEVLFIFIKLIIIKNKKITGIIVLFKSHLIYPFIFIFSKFIKKTILIDFGYPFEDNSNYKNNFIKFIYKCIEHNFLNDKNINILLESKSQIIRLKKQFKYSNLYCHYMTKSKGLTNQLDNSDEANYQDRIDLEKLLNSNYILFRGRLNYESGILKIIDLFREFTLLNDQINLIIHGEGILEKQVAQKLQEKSFKNIIFINKFISNNNMEKLMKNAIGILGQFNNYKNRLNLTIPNKYYEALKLHKFYITPNWDPIKKPYLEKTNSLFPSIDKNYNLTKWLIDNYDVLINKKNEIKRISNECIDWHESLNRATLHKILFNRK
ncbi:glycosyltransferase [Prochlorococcus sp. AH-736-E15]|nr:glycosyltransferase [Prochlorococcus sp. AH-736-E15]